MEYSSEGIRRAFCENLKAFREEKKLKKVDLAKKINALAGTQVSGDNVYTWESQNKVSLPPVPLLPVLSIVLEKPIGAFFGVKSHGMDKEAEKERLQEQVGKLQAALSEVHQILKD